MDGWVECIPNFSEGRQPSTVRALVAVVRAVPGVFLLGEEMDADHHRAVLTFAGEPDAVAEAAFQCARLAADLIDLRGHEGGILESARRMSFRLCRLVTSAWIAVSISPGK